MKRWLVVLVFLALPLAAQLRQNFVLNVGTPEGQLLQQIGREIDDVHKVEMMKDFLDKYPKHEGAGWVSAQLEAAYVQQKDYDKALETGEKVYGSGPDDMDVAYNALKAAEAKEDVEQMKKWAARTSEAARKITGTGKPPADDDEKQRVEYAKQVDAYSEYALYVVALKAKEPKAVVDLVEALEHQNPKSQYLWLATPNYLRATGAKACAAAGRLAAGDSKNAEAMLVSADCSWRGQKAESVVSNATRALDALNTRPRVEGGNEASKIGSANFYAGIGYAMQMKWGPANKALRAALPAVKGDTVVTANALFNLGLSNYSLGKAIGDRSQMREGLHFFEQSAEIKSNVQDQAERNARLIKAELGGK
jgi:tetratricopeptide (TPR) repeat protein